MSPRRGVSKKGALRGNRGSEGPPWAILRLCSASLGSSASSHLPHQKGPRRGKKSARGGKKVLCSSCRSRTRCLEKDRDAPELRLQAAGCLERQSTCKYPGDSIYNGIYSTQHDAEAFPRQRRTNSPKQGWGIVAGSNVAAPPESQKPAAKGKTQLEQPGSSANAATGSMESPHCVVMFLLFLLMPCWNLAD